MINIQQLINVDLVYILCIRDYEVDIDQLFMLKIKVYNPIAHTDIAITIAKSRFLKRLKS